MAAAFLYVVDGHGRYWRIDPATQLDCRHPPADGGGQLRPVGDPIGAGPFSLPAAEAVIYEAARERSSASRRGLDRVGAVDASATAAAVTSSTLTAGRPTKSASIRASSVRATSARRGAHRDVRQLEPAIPVLVHRLPFPGVGPAPTCPLSLERLRYRRNECSPYNSAPSSSADPAQGLGELGGLVAQAKQGELPVGSLGGLHRRNRVQRTCRHRTLRLPGPNESRLARLAGSDARGKPATRRTGPAPSANSRSRRLISVRSVQERGARGISSRADRRARSPAGLAGKPQLVVQVSQGPAQQGEQAARSPGRGPLQHRIQRQVMEVALKSPYVHLVADQTVHGVVVGGREKRLVDVQQALHAGDACLEQVPDQLGLRMAVAGSQGEHLERAASAGGHDLLSHLAERQTASQGRRKERF